MDGILVRTSSSLIRRLGVDFCADDGIAVSSCGLFARFGVSLRYSLFVAHTVPHMLKRKCRYWEIVRNAF